MFLACCVLSLATAPFSAEADEAQVAKYLEALETATGAELYAAVDGLGSQGAAAKSAAPKLVGLLADDDENLRWRAARALGAIGPDAADAVPELTTALADEAPLVRAQAVYALGQMGDAAKPATAEIVKVVMDEDPLVRRAALRALDRIKPDRSITIPLFAKLLEEAPPEVVVAVLHSMAEMGKDALPAVSDALDNEKAQYWACLVAAEIGPDAAPLVPKLTNLVQHKIEPETRMQAILALAEIGPAAKEAVPTIIEQFTADEHNAIRYAAAHALANIGAVEAKAVLQKAVDDNAGEKGDKFLELSAARALSKLFPEDKAIEKQAVDAFIAGLSSEDRNVRQAAVQSLAESKAPSEAVAPAVVAAIAKADEETIRDVVRMLSSMGAAAVPRVRNGLANEKLRGYSVVILGNIGPEAKDAVPDLVTALDVDDAEFRREVLFTLGRIGPASAPAVDKITEILKTDENERVLSAACYALGSIGTPASKAAPALVEMYNEGTEFQRMLAIWALLKVRPGFESVVSRAIPMMIKGLSHERVDVRVEAARALGDIGPKAVDSLDALKKAETADENEAVRAAAKEAIAKITAPTE
jgi:HEAT repeat protein